MSEITNESIMKEIYEKAGISSGVFELASKALSEVDKTFSKIDAVAEYNQARVLMAFKNQKIGYEHLLGSTGYGYDDAGRDKFEALMAEIFDAEDALVRAQLISGTHALTVALRGVLRPGDELLYATGKPYDTMESIIGLGDNPESGSLTEFGITYAQADMANGLPDYDEIAAKINDKTKMVAIQRSKGYSSRKSLSCAEIAKIIEVVRAKKSDVIIMVDNCYGEFVETKEPTSYGADMCVGSLIKNPGGGIAPMGGYIVGTKEVVKMCSSALYSPGLYKEAGASLNINRSFYQGIYMSPVVVANALKTAIFAAKLYEMVGFKTIPESREERADIIQAISLGNGENICAFCEGIQAASPIDGHITPVPYAMPGYHCDVIMAAGTFVQGSSIELSADAPIEEPYNVYFQGGLTFAHGKYAICNSLQYMINKGLINI